MPRGKKSTKLTIDHIKSDDKKYDKLKKVTFENGMFTEVYAAFRPTKIETMLQDFSDYLVEHEKEIGPIVEDDVLDYLNMHILLHFSTLFDGMPTDIHEKSDVFLQALDNEYAEKCFDEFDKNELNKVYTRMFKKIEAYQDLLKSNVDLQKQLRDYVRNSDLKNKDIIEDVMLGGAANGE